MPLILTFGLSLLQSRHVFHLDAETEFVLKRQGLLSSCTCEMMPIANEVSLCAHHCFCRRDAMCGLAEAPAGIEWIRGTEQHIVIARNPASTNRTLYPFYVHATPMNPY
jgi:hypothetical protein